MKHRDSGNLKILKQLRKCPEIKDIRATAKGFMLMATNGKQYLAHLSPKAHHPLRKWCRENTSIKQLKF
tara:strand:+ start:421 stop:627 length:207 start_codon:yes stop_codon:yes gene_type:complete